jgi:hypothetical protein
MERLSLTSWRKFFAICFVFAGVITLAQEAHCLAATAGLEAIETNSRHASADHAPQQTHEQQHTCHHDEQAGAHAGWTFLHQTASNLSAPILASLAASSGHGYVTAQDRAPRTTTRERSPPPPQTITSFDSVLTTNGRLLI